MGIIKFFDVFEDFEILNNYNEMLQFFFSYHSYDFSQIFTKLINFLKFLRKRYFENFEFDFLNFYLNLKSIFYIFIKI